MADIDSNQPIFSRGTSAPVIVSATTGANLTTNPIFVRLTDGADASLISAGGALSVILAANSGVDIGDVDVTSVIPGTGATNLGKAEDAVAADGDTGVMALTVRRDTAASSAGLTGDYATLNTNSTGDLYVSLDGETVTTTFNASFTDDAAYTVAVDKVVATGGIFDDTATDSVDEGDIGVFRMTADRKQLTRIVGATDTNRLDIDASGHAQVDIAAISVTAVPVSKNSSANAETNPLFVQVVSGVVSGIEVISYDTSAAIAVDASDNHDYTVTAAKTLKVQKIMASASGAMKVEVQSGPVLSLTTKAVGFSSATQPFVEFEFYGLLEVPDTSTGTLRIIRTNRDEAAMDVYSTIIGTEV